jgi:8-oxo-dGTP pyrophosphatase MutT (NUDIX family)
MYITPAMVAEWESRYGVPRRWRHKQPITPRDYDIIHGSQHDGRAHDITLYIEADGRIAVIAKPFYPPGLFRAPSGSLKSGESLEDGAGREGYEETGLRIQLTSYLLRATVVFAEGARTIDWCTHVFTATTDDRVIAPTDHVEIREARWAKPEEFATFTELMRRSDRGGLHYRAALHEQVAGVHPVFRQV